MVDQILDCNFLDVQQARFVHAVASHRNPMLSKWLLSRNILLKLRDIISGPLDNPQFDKALYRVGVRSVGFMAGRSKSVREAIIADGFLDTLLRSYQFGAPEDAVFFVSELLRLSIVSNSSDDFIQKCLTITEDL
jgi:hypothetical protein